ncbi:hypothetical protein FIBSPDRAFT_121832 [Athelia psychrophila]|uniref:Uncharacterized protein n=1 Tax=Athelia psychrophila TaxID=1759441 RepID=A0A166CQ04_9AGAM|nr:hypothetical protein FIBSPDRAFT_121832 [Fibularhizoctonia sp. CBS 109695]
MRCQFDRGAPVIRIPFICTQGVAQHSSSSPTGWDGSGHAMRCQFELGADKSIAIYLLRWLTAGRSIGHQEQRNMGMSVVLRSRLEQRIGEEWCIWCVVWEMRGRARASVMAHGQTRSGKLKGSTNWMQSGVCRQSNTAQAHGIKITHPIHQSRCVYESRFRRTR